MKTTAMTAAMICVLFLLQPLAEAQTPQFSLRVDVVERTASAIAYPHRNGSTTIGFRGTSLQPGARGEAKVESKQGYVEIEVEFDDMIPATRYGREYLTYVMWSVTPQGRTTNLGEVILNGTKSKLNVTTELQTFGLIVTAEPYFAVTQPTDRVVLENVILPGTKAEVQQISAKYDLSEKSRYSFDKMPRDLRPTLIETTLPPDLQQARHAVRIAESGGARRFVPDLLSDLREMLSKAEELYVEDANPKIVAMAAREVVQNAEDTRLVTLQVADRMRLR